MLGHQTDAAKAEDKASRIHGSLMKATRWYTHKLHIILSAILCLISCDRMCLSLFIYRYIHAYMCDFLFVQCCRTQLHVCLYMHTCPYHCRQRCAHLYCFFSYTYLHQHQVWNVLAAMLPQQEKTEIKELFAKIMCGGMGSSERSWLLCRAVSLKST